MPLSSSSFLCSSGALPLLRVLHGLLLRVLLRCNRCYGCLADCILDVYTIECCNECLYPGFVCCYTCGGKDCLDAILIDLLACLVQEKCCIDIFHLVHLNI